MALRNAAGVALPLAIGIAIGDPLGAVAITTGALNVAYSDGRDPYAQRARRMLLWCFLGALAVFLGSVTGKYDVPAIAMAAAWAFGAGLLVSVSTRAADLGLNTLVTLIVFAARGALSPKGALIAASLVLGGGLLQTLLAVLFWPVQRYEPERRAIGSVYRELAKEVDPHTDILAKSPLDTPSQEVQDTLSALGQDHSVEGERFRLLFDQADRLRLSIYLVGRLRPELPKEMADTLDRLLELSSMMLAGVGEYLIEGRSGKEQSNLLDSLDGLVKTAQSYKETDLPLGTEIGSAVDVLAGQLRLVTQLAGHASESALEGLAKQDLALPWKLQLTSWVATLRANLDLRSGAFRHAIRLAVCVAAGDAIGRAITFQRTYWLPMTVAVVLKPDFTTTFSRGLLRLLGTYAGLLLATLLYHALPHSAFTQLVLVGVFTFFMRYVGPGNYGVFSIAISGLIVFLIAETGVPPSEVVLERFVNTSAGGVLALIAYMLWPTWERKQVSDTMAEMLDASRDYFRAVAERFGRDEPELEARLDRTRSEWRRARSNAEASVDRVASEPGTSAQKLDCLTSMLASSHALVHSVMGLEAGVLENPPHTPPEAFRMFANSVEYTLYFLAAALRGSPAAHQTLPKLRQDHRRLIAAREHFSPTDEFVLLETDRLTVSLNTLREQVLRFTGQ
jgi:uncharacterized membrane protein YccC